MRFTTKRYSITSANSTKPPITILKDDDVWVIFTDDIFGVWDKPPFFDCSSSFPVLLELSDQYLRKICFPDTFVLTLMLLFSYFLLGFDPCWKLFTVNFKVLEIFRNFFGQLNETVAKLKV